MLPPSIQALFERRIRCEIGIIALTLLVPMLPASAQPSINALHPQSGTPNTAVRIYGAGFSTTASDNTVTFGDIQATVDSAKANVIYTTVPSDVTTGLISVNVTTNTGSATATELFMALTADQGADDFEGLDAGLDGVTNGSSSGGDFNNDGILDLVITGTNAQSNRTATLYLGDGSGGFTKADAGLVGVNGGDTSVGDVDNDGNLDLLITGTDTSGTESTTLYLGDGSGDFEVVNAGLTDVTGGATALGDIDGDGNLDLVLTGRNGGNSLLELYAGDGTGGFSLLDTTLPVIVGTADFGDVNGDGALDVLLTGIGTDGSADAALALGDGTGSFTAAEAGIHPVDRSAASIADVNNDGALDLLVAGRDTTSQEVTALYLGQGNGSFTTAEAGLTNVDVPSTTIGDLNGDGNPDLLVTGADTADVPTSTVYLGDGTGSFSVADAGLTGVLQSSTSLGDTDADGDLDLLLTGYDDNFEATAAHYENQNFTGPADPSISPSSLSETLQFGRSSTQSIEIANVADSGAADLDYRIDILSSSSSSSKTKTRTLDGPAHWSLDWPSAEEAPKSTTELESVAYSKSHSGSPPVTIEDPVGDADSSDVDHIRTSVTDNQINVVIQHGTIDTSAYAAVLYLDVDQDTSTGITTEAMKPDQEIGAEYQVFYDPTSSESALIVDTTSSIVAEVPVGVDSSAVHYALPLSEIDGRLPMNTVAITGTPSAPKDWIPDAGNWTIGPQWISVSPSSGSVPPGGSESVETLFSADDTAPGEYDATMRITADNSEPDTVEVPVSLTVESPSFSFTNPSDPPTPGTGASVTVDVPSSFSPIDGTVFYRAAGQRAFRDSSRDLSDVGAGGTFSFSIPGDVVTETGVQYYLKVRGVPTSGTDTLVVSAPRTAPIKTGFLPVDMGTVTAKGTWQAERYRMLTVPAALGDRSPFDVLETQYGSYDPSTWRLARWAPSDSSYRFGADVDSLRPGRAAWLITSGGDSLRIENAHSPDASGLQRIRLEPGWNQIGTPFSFPVAWADVRRPDAVRRPILYDPSLPEGERYRFDTQTLPPWRGAFVYNEADSTASLWVPPVRASTSKDVRESKSTDGIAEAAASEGTYRLQPVAALHRDNQSFRDSNTLIGFSESAERGFGPKDRAKPPRIGPHLRMQVLPDEGPALAHSLKPPTTEGAVWNLRVGLHTNGPISSPEEVTIALREHGMRPPDFQRYVLDLDRHERLPITNNSVTVPLTEDQPTRRLQMIVGTEAFAREKSNETSLSVQETKLQKNAPNPFTESTTISYQLANDTDVRIVIYDILGRHVQTVVDKAQDEGVYEVEWGPEQASGPSLASGVYLCRMEAGSYSGTRKLVLVR